MCPGTGTYPFFFSLFFGSRSKQRSALGRRQLLQEEALRSNGQESFHATAQNNERFRMLSHPYPPALSLYFLFFEQTVFRGFLISRVCFDLSGYFFYFFSRIWTVFYESYSKLVNFVSERT